MMPDLDGWTVLAAIKGDPELAGIPVVLMSIVDQKNRGYVLVAADYLVKPVDRATLMETLRNVCGATAGRALLVDDDDMVRRNVRQALEPTGWKVTEAENGQVAVNSLTTGRPDVIILDLMMPTMDGFEFIDELRGRPDWRDIPVVVITAKDLTDEDRDRVYGEVERIIQKSDRDEMLRQLGREIGKWVKAVRRRQAIHRSPTCTDLIEAHVRRTQPVAELLKAEQSGEVAINMINKERELFAAIDAEETPAARTRHIALAEHRAWRQPRKLCAQPRGCLRNAPQAE